MTDTVENSPRHRPANDTPCLTVPDEVLEMLRHVSTATLSTALFKRGLRNQMIQAVQPLAPLKQNMVGIAYTLRYIPAREDLNPISVFDDADHPQRKAVESCPPGAVMVIDSRGNARDRWWKAAHQGTEFDKAELLDQEPELALGFLHGVGQSYAENIFSFIDAMQTMPADWRDASVLSDWFFHLRADQLDAMMHEVLAVLEKYKTADLTSPLPEGAEQVTVQIQAFPRETR